MSKRSPSDPGQSARRRQTRRRRAVCRVGAIVPAAARARARRLGVGLLPACILLLSGCGLMGDPDERVFFPPGADPREYHYVKLARQLASEKPCYLISGESVSVAPLNSPGTRAQLVRSQCFATVARRAARPELCEHVVSVNTFLYPGHRNDRERCIEAAEQATASAGIGIIDHDAMFRLAGFSDEEIDDRLQAHQLPPDGRYCLIFSPEFFERIEQMPRFSPDDDLETMKTIEWRPHPFLRLPGFPCSGRFIDTTSGPR